MLAAKYFSPMFDSETWKQQQQKKINKKTKENKKNKQKKPPKTKINDIISDRFRF